MTTQSYKAEPSAVFQQELEACELMFTQLFQPSTSVLYDSYTLAPPSDANLNANE